MKLLVVAPDKRRLDSEELNSLGTVCAYNLLRYLKLWSTVSLADHRDVKNGALVGTFDAALVTINNGLVKSARRGFDLYAVLKEAVGGGPVGVISENLRTDSGDIVFGMKPPRSLKQTIPFGWKRLGSNGRATSVFIGWAADSERFFPAKIAVGRLLVDNARPHGRDMTKSILEQCLKFKAESHVVIEVWWIGPYGLQQLETVPPQVDIGRCSSSEFADVLSITDVFFVTHYESLGLGVIEAAMSGCLVVVPAGFVSGALLRPLRHVRWKQHIDWSQVVNAVSSQESRKAAAPFDRWADIAKIIVDSFGEALRGN